MSIQMPRFVNENLFYAGKGWNEGVSGYMFRDCIGNPMSLKDMCYSLLWRPEHQFSARRLRDYWAQSLGRAEGGVAAVPLFAYLHFPYCRRQCTYCVETTRQLREETELDGYIQQLLAEARFYRKTFSEAEFSFLLVGGGTPSLLSERQLETFFSAYFSFFRFKKDAWRSLECDPRTLNEEKPAILKRLGFTRLSLGVQTFDEALLRILNRGDQDRASVERAATAIQRQGFRHGFNIDIVAGLAGQDIESIFDSFARAAGLGATQITVYPLRITPRYEKAALGTDRARHQEHVWEMLHELCERLPAFAERFGFVFIGYSASMSLSKPAPVDQEWMFFLTKKSTGTAAGPALVDDYFVSPAAYSYFALGASAHGHIAGRLHYLESVRPRNEFDPDALFYKGQVMSRRQEMLWYILAQLESAGFLSLKRFRERFGRRPEDSFGPFLRGLVGSRLAALKDDRLILERSRNGERLCVCTFKDPWLRETASRSRRYRYELPFESEGREGVLSLEDVQPGSKYIRRSGVRGLSLCGRTDPRVLPARSWAQAFLAMRSAQMETDGRCLTDFVNGFYGRMKSAERATGMRVQPPLARICTDHPYRRTEYFWMTPLDPSWNSAGQTAAGLPGQKNDRGVSD